MENPLQIYIAATFTANPVREPLEHILGVAGMPATVDFAEYNQVFQELIRPDSVSARNRSGINVLLLRLEDWSGVERHALASLPEGCPERSNIERNTQDFLTALTGAASGSPTSFILALCPHSAALAKDPAAASFLASMEWRMRQGMAAVPNVSFCSAADIARIYPVDEYDDAGANSLGHIPYTDAYFAALALALARRIYRIRTAPPKVIVLDLDNTLWTGVAGEDGPAGIVLDEHRLFLHRFMLAQQQAGVLLCICSKNNEEDAWAVFDQRTDLLLRPEHFVASRINWEHKSANLRALAAELSLGLDSMIFVDDDPAVCAEVRQNCPDVTVVHLPSDTARIPSLLRNLWIFDRPKTTPEDQRRTDSYRQNRARNELRRSAVDFTQFLDSLALEVHTGPMKQEQLARVAQLTVRTNQFNSTTLRRSEADIQELIAERGFECWVTEVKDRFGDYGLVGVTLHHIIADTLHIDSFLMSCRVLGRGVEHRMVANLGRIACNASVQWVDIRFVQSAKNKPAWDFLSRLPAAVLSDSPDGMRFRLPAEAARDLDCRSFAIAEAVQAPASEGSATLQSAPGSGPTIDALLRIARDYGTPERLAEQLGTAHRAPLKGGDSVPPRTETERHLAGLWARLLNVPAVGIHDNFFDLGGDSFLAVRMFVEIEQQLGRELGLASLFDAPTIEQLAALIDTPPAAAWSCLVPIQQGGTRPNLYCMHAAGGNVLFYRDLARWLGPDQPVFGLQAQGLSKTLPWHRRVEEMAACYIREIRAVQPLGPYYLAGSSFGGLIAYEMARQLRAQGHTIGLLALLDTYGLGYPQFPQSTGRVRKRFYRLLSRVQTHWHNLLLLTWSGRCAYVVDRMHRATRRAQRNWTRTRNEIAAQYHKAIGQAMPEHLQQTQDAILEALHAYTYPLYEGDVTLFRAHNQPVGAISIPDLGWASVVKGRLSIEDVPGHHGAITVDPHAVFLARKLKPCLETAFGDSYLQLPASNGDGFGATRSGKRR